MGNFPRPTVRKVNLGVLDIAIYWGRRGSLILFCRGGRPVEFSQLNIPTGFLCLSLNLED